MKCFPDGMTNLSSGKKGSSEEQLTHNWPAILGRSMTGENFEGTESAERKLK